MGILVCGLNGAGKSTVGRMLAVRLGYEFIDNEDLYFPKADSNYAYSDPRSKEEVVSILEERIKDNPNFVFAAVKGDYGDNLIDALDYVVLIDVPKEIRSRRVRDRSFQKFGERTSREGDLFIKEQSWFHLVDSRPEDDVLRWLETIQCPVVRIDGTLPVEENVNELMSILGSRS